MKCRTPEKSRGTDTDDTDDKRVLAGEACALRVVAGEDCLGGGVPEKTVQWLYVNEGYNS